MHTWLLKDLASGTHFCIAPLRDSANRIKQTKCANVAHKFAAKQQIHSNFAQAFRCNCIWGTTTDWAHTQDVLRPRPICSLTTLNACLYCNGHNWKLRSWHFLYYLILLNHYIYWLDKIGGDPWSIADSTRSEKLWVPKTPRPKIPKHSFAI